MEKKTDDEQINTKLCKLCDSAVILTFDLKIGCIWNRILPYRQKVPGWPTSEKILKFAYNEHFIIPWGNRRGFVNAGKAM